MSGLPQRTLRAIFCVYACVVFALTHWPALTLSLPIRRPDLWAHLTVFSIWTVLASLCGFFGPALSGHNVLRTFALAVVYAAIDEGLQAIPWLRRTCAWDDYLANVLGITLGVVLVLIVKTLLVRKGTANDATI